MQEYSIVKIKSYEYRNWILLNVTQDDLDQTTINTDKTGLHAFGGMWYGENPMDRNSFGKILEIDEDDIENVLIDDVRKLPMDQAHKLLGFYLYVENDEEP